MKKLTLLFVAIFSAGVINAQSNVEEVDMVQSIFGMEKKAIIAEFVKVPDASKDAFWALYDEYEVKRKDLGKRKLELLNQYAENYDKLTNEMAESWTKEVISVAAKTDDLLVTYQKKISKATNPIAALQFYQIEGYILSGIRVAVLESLPLPDVK